jgi:hypothetical protein
MTVSPLAGTVSPLEHPPHQGAALVTPFRLFGFERRPACVERLWSSGRRASPSDGTCMIYALGDTTIISNACFISKHSCRRHSTTNAPAWRGFCYEVHHIACDGNSARIQGYSSSSAVHSKMKINRGADVRALVPTPVLSEEEGNELVDDCISKLIMVCLVIWVVQICVIYLILDFCLAGSYGKTFCTTHFLKFKRESMAMFQESTIQRCEPQQTTSQK